MSSEIIFDGASNLVPNQTPYPQPVDLSKIFDSEQRLPDSVLKPRKNAPKELKGPFLDITPPMAP